MSTINFPNSSNKGSFVTGYSENEEAFYSLESSKIYAFTNELINEINQGSKMEDQAIKDRIISRFPILADQEHYESILLDIFNSVRCLI